MSHEAGMERITALQRLTAACEAIAQGRLEEVEGLFAIVADEALPADIRRLAETFGSMVVQVEAREFHADQLTADLKATQRQLEAACRSSQR